MAVESEEVLKMVPVEEQPIDLSKTMRKAPRSMPPLIPISILRAGLYDHHLFCKRNGKINLASNLSLPPGTEIFTIKANDKLTMNSKKPNVVKQVRTKSIISCNQECLSERHSASCNQHNVHCDKIPRKRHFESEQLEDDWIAKRLDRAHSVPHLTPFPFALQRQKSLSESRIPLITTLPSSSPKTVFYSHDSDVSSNFCNSPDQPHLSNLCQRLLREDLLIDGNWSNNHDLSVVKSSYNYLDYHPKLLHECHTQDLLQQYVLQHQKDDTVEHGIENISSNAVQVELPSEGCNDLKLRSSRPLTGKHVRPGTGASPATLLSLRRKIQARQQQHE
ncbi:uncharacterized protein LOC134529419 isoform X2 [Bacillus rossius redtenbacheri]|uniref:uncharacterized protein LOC134529419 isoform X2 n=1 Tax=Bacillus rossius redtenbacheri TaxID=93214 RepID=UPI002FDEEF6D